jgi:uncharacterized membrane protein YgaE (UPF0421/DUF939 family)
VREGLWPLVQTAVAAALAWLVAAKLLGDPNPFFAPVAAIMSLAVTRGQRLRGAIELIVGVAIGVGLGDLLTREIGIGVGQLGLTVALAMCAALALGAGQMLLTEAAVSAALVGTVSQGTRGFPPTRLLDALVGGAVALIFSQLLFPVNPVKVLRAATESILHELAEVLRETASALERRDLGAAEHALLRAQNASDDWSRFEQALDAAREAAQYAPRRRRQRESFGAYSEAELPLGLMIRDVHVLARGAVRALMMDDEVPSRLIAALRDLAEATGQLTRRLAADESGQELSDAVLQAASATSEGGENLSRSVLVAYIQATAADVLRALGSERRDAHERVGEAVRTGPSGPSGSARSASSLA